MFFLGVLGLVKQHNVGGVIALLLGVAIGVWAADGRSWLGPAFHAGERYVVADGDGLTIGSDHWPWTAVEKVTDQHVKYSTLSLTALDFVLRDGSKRWINLNYLDIKGNELEAAVRRRIEHAGLLARLSA